jgi:hypothetical protein
MNTETKKNSREQNLETAQSATWHGSTNLLSSRPMLYSQTELTFEEVVVVELCKKKHLCF